jgi:hypothetical protein
MSNSTEITMKNVGNPIFTPAIWVVDARGGLRLASEAEREPVVFVARVPSGRRNGRKRSCHASHPVKGVAP